MPASINATVTANAPKQAVWKVLADFPNIARYTDTVKASVSTSEQAFGVGASRHCDLAPAGSAEEEIVEIVPGERLVIIVEGNGSPIKQSRTTFSLSEINANVTQLTMDAELHAKGGIFAGIVAKILEKRLPKRAEKVVRDLATAAEKNA